MKSLAKKDLIVLQNSAIVIIDNMVATFDNSNNGGAPLLAIAWGLSKGLYGAGVQLRQDRAVEFVEMIRDNPGIFTKQLLQTEEFQDAFVYVFQKYLSERVAEKRKTIKRIFCGFCEEENKQDFKLERFLNTLEQLSADDIEVLKIFSDGMVHKWIENQFPDMPQTKVKEMAELPLNVTQFGDLILNEMKNLPQFKDRYYTLEILVRLSALGLFLGGISLNDSDYSGSHFRISGFGQEFISYILE